MGVERAIPELIADADHVTRLFHQLRDVPQEVCDLFDLLGNSRQFLSLTSTQLTRRHVPSESTVASGKVFRRSRTHLLHLELFLDPNSQLHQSGPNSLVRKAVPWPAKDEDHVRDFCRNFRARLIELDSECQKLLTALLTSPQNDTESQYTLSRASPSPSVVPSEKSADSQVSSPRLDARRSKPKRVSPRMKTEEQIIMDKFVAHYYPASAGSKRKRPESTQQPEAAPQPGKALSPLLSVPFPFPLSRDILAGSPMATPARLADPTWMFDDLHNALPSAPTPTYFHLLSSAPSPQSAALSHAQSPNLTPPNFRSSDIVPLQDALSSNSPPPRAFLSSKSIPSERSRGKQKATNVDNLVNDYSSSSSGSIRSLPISREGSIFTVQSKDRTFEEGATKLWHVRGRTMQQIPIDHIEIRRVDRARGEGIVIACRTGSGQEILDDLWMPQAGANSSPFLENCNIVSTFRQRDKNANFVVCFAPNPSIHPQYSFARKEDCWDFMQAIVDKTLCASLDVESIKSACTHGNSVESGCETLQIWEDSIYTLRTVKFFRNKNLYAKPRLVEFNVTSFRLPDNIEKRTGKLVVYFRDGLDGTSPTKDMRYLKIAFANADLEEEFLQQVGFEIPPMAI